MGFEVGEVKTRLDRLRGASPEIVSAALLGVATQVMEESTQLVPVGTGQLKGSAYVAEPTRSDSVVQIELGYGAAHAVRVHEDMSTTHPSGEAKFLEKPMSNENSIRGRLVALIQKGIKNGRLVITPKFPTRPR